MKKNSILLIILFFLSNCGYSPIYSNNKNINFHIERINFNKGDAFLIQQLKSNLKKYLIKKTDSSKILIDANIIYKKQIVSKDKEGIASQYTLTSQATFLIQFNDLTKTITIDESLNMDNFEDEFSEIQYERNIKQNMARSISSKLITQLIRLNDN